MKNDRRIKKYVYIIVWIFVMLIIVIQSCKLYLKKEYEDMAYKSIKRAVQIIENYKEDDNAEELIELVGELSIFSASIDKLEEYDSDMEYRSDIEKAKSVLISKKKQIEGFEYLYEGLLAVEDDIYSDIGYSYLNSFVNENTVH